MTHQVERAAAAKLFSTSPGGLSTLGPEVLGIMDAIDRQVCAWADEVGAVSMRYPTLLRATDLQRIDYFVNFPHLGLGAAPIAAEHQAQAAAHVGEHGCLSGAVLAGADYVLPSAACFGIYFDLAGQRLSNPVYITTVASCFRNEDRFDALRRLLGFTMREIVCLGTRQDTEEHLRALETRINDYHRSIGLPLAWAAATDPFFAQDSARLAMQKLFPVKRELLYRDELAVASLNFHRNFFGERCDIQLADGTPVFTSCVAFGLERWAQALLEHCDGNVTRIREALTVAI